MKRLLLAFVILLLGFSWFSAVKAQAQCLETWIDFYEGQTPYCQWTPPPVWPPVSDLNYLDRSPNEIGQCGCEAGVSQFDQVWRLPKSDSWIYTVEPFADLNFYVSTDSTNNGFFVYDLSGEFPDLTSYCKFSEQFSFNLKNIEGFSFNPDQPIYIRVFSEGDYAVGTEIFYSAQSICAMRFCADETINTRESSWGAVKSIYR